MMDYMGFVLFLWIVGGASVGMFIIDRVADRTNTSRVQGGRPVEARA
ncbi:hypothetical protein [Alsobacter sp. SYSU BS001988]